MQTLKSVIFIACAVGIVSSAVRLAAPAGGISKNLNMVIGAVMLLAVVSPFMDSRFELSLPKPDEAADAGIPSSMTELSKQYYLSSAENSVEKYLREKLRSAGYESAYTDIKAELDEYNYIVISSVTLYNAPKGSEQALTELVREDIPDCETTIYNGADSVAMGYEKDKEAALEGAEI